MSLITIEEAMQQLKAFPMAEEEVDRLREEASAIVLDYVTVPAKLLWTEATAPGNVKAATKIVLTVLYDHRTDDPLTDGVKNLLRRLRDPAVA
jgi:hypothetical protein